MDLIIVVKISQSCYLFGRTLLQHRLIQLAGFAGASDQKAFPVLIEQALRNPGAPCIIGQMRLCNKLVQIISSYIILREDDNMMGGRLADRIDIAVTIAVHFF